LRGNEGREQVVLRSHDADFVVGDLDALRQGRAGDPAHRVALGGIGSQVHDALVLLLGDQHSVEPRQPFGVHVGRELTRDIMSTVQQIWRRGEVRPRPEMPVVDRQEFGSHERSLGMRAAG
jgi:hypothetical protein